MDFCILGPLEVSEGGDPIALGGPRQRALLALLLLRANEPVARDWLIDELWEARTPRSGATALHNQVARLRRTLGPERLLTCDDGYVLRVEPGELDVHRFCDLIAGADGSTARLREALALWRGTPLAGIQLGPFAQGEVARLEELRLEAVEDLLDAELEQGRHAELVPELTALVASYPLSERLRGQLILALYRSGRQAEALDVYRETRRLLDEELGLEPGPALKELERAILRHDPELAPAKPRAEPVRSTRKWRLGYLLAAALVLAAAGGSTGWLLARDRAVQPPAATAQGATSTPEAEPVAAPVAPAIAPPKLVKAGAKPRSKPRPARTAPTVTAKPAPVTTTAPEPPPAKTRPSQETTPARPTTTTTKAARPKPFTISDDFSGASVDPLIWYTLGKENGAVFSQRDGRLELTIALDAQPDQQWNQVGGHVGTHCRFTGDFDARVDFELLSWPEGSGAFAGMNLFFANAFVARQSSRQWGDQYTGWVKPNGTGMALPDLSGRLRMTRVGGAVTTYFWLSGRWRRLIAGVARGTSVLGLQLQADGNEFTREEVRVAYDNFVVTATEADCPAFADPRG